MENNSQMDAAKANAEVNVLAETSFTSQALGCLKITAPAAYEHLEKILSTQSGQIVLEIAPHRIRRSGLANRHVASFSGEDFNELRESIKTRGGNSVPVLIRPIVALNPAPNQTNFDGPLFEVIAGHRRHQACREVGVDVRAIVVPFMTDSEAAMTMFDENASRVDITPFESGQMYLTWLEQKLFSSQARLAKAIGKSPSDVSRTLVLAKLPKAVLQAFESPLVLQLKDAEELRAILGGSNRSEVLRAATELANLPSKKKRGEVIRLLKAASDGPVADVGSTNAIRKTDLFVGDQIVGSIAWDGRGKGRMSLNQALTTAAQLTFEEMLVTLVKNAFSRSMSTPLETVSI